MHVSFFYLIALFLLFYHGKVSSQENLKLELVQVLFRHGARTPLKQSLNFYTRANRSIYEPWGIEALTNVGKQQSYNLGSFLRYRYKDHLSVDYKAEELYAYSSSEDRTKMTMELVLAGLYPPSGNAIWNPSLLWSPIPYKFTPMELDVLLRGFENPKFKNLFGAVQNSSENQLKLKKFAETLRSLNVQTGVDATANFTTLTYIFDVLYANEYINTSLPDWYTPDVKETLLEVQRLICDHYVETEELRKIAVGYLIRTFVENMNLNKTKNNPRKIYLYSAHESDQGAFTRVHGIKEFRYPNFGDALIFEKWRDSDDKVYVRLFAWRGSEDLLIFKLGSHDNFCPIEDYLKIVKPIMVNDNEVEDILKEYSATQLKKLFFEDTAVTSNSEKTIH